MFIWKCFIVNIYFSFESYVYTVEAETLSGVEMKKKEEEKYFIFNKIYTKKVIFLFFTIVLSQLYNELTTSDIDYSALNVGRMKNSDQCPYLGAEVGDHETTV